MKDLSIESYKYAKAIRFKRDKLKDEDKLKRLLAYQTHKIEERLKGIQASPLRFNLFEQDMDNIVKNLVTAYWWADVIKIND